MKTMKGYLRKYVDVWRTENFRSKFKVNVNECEPGRWSFLNPYGQLSSL